MNAFLASSVVRRVTTWVVSAALLAPTLVACTTPQGSAGGGAARLDGIVVDGSRQAQAGEPGLAFVVSANGVRRDAVAGTVLYAGDRIQTGPRADAVIRYPSGTEVLMRPNSSGRIGSLTEVIGEFFVKVKGAFSVDTTFVSAGARGTAFLVRTYAGGTTSVVVVEGVVDVASTTGAWAPLPLTAGTMATAYPRPPQRLPANLDELARTRDWVERVERLSPPPAGVSHAGIIGAVVIGALIAAMIASHDHDSSPPPRNDRETYTPPPRTDRETRTPSPPPSTTTTPPPPPNIRTTRPPASSPAPTGPR
jgi:FecR protein